MLVRDKVEKVIGKSFADRLDEEIFKVSVNWFYTRREMVEILGCANFVAAANLAKVLKRLDVTTPAQLFKMNPIDLARAKGIGESALFVALCILESKGLNAVEWWGYRGNEVKFGTFKHNAVRKARKSKHEV